MAKKAVLKMRSQLQLQYSQTMVRLACKLQHLQLKDSSRKKAGSRVEAVYTAWQAANEFLQLSPWELKQK